ncbi:hypothetical protein [Streptomyces tsukubensis]|uniref:DNA-directed RNA polymerase specialized sigma24 family protein n=1 Tax=Streptomyces tsukubensis TaxID=83656 RepID=A0A1V4A769_9ACTN|nr:hypothetical protein [Streptomyces tsukubensis]OON77283.1 hypothetical protein B1H18_18700 [Streptomyces tsukubensis]QFR92358.1 hypothetical protein GBW32_03925 [Streptomyces tsukubensis]
MPTFLRQRPSAGERIDLQKAEAALVEQYARLVRLSYLVLPPALGRHRRVLAAHSTVQRALPGTGRRPAARRLPAQRGTSAHPGYDWVREQILRSALTYERRPRGWPRRLPPPRALRPGLPTVWGLRLFPRAGGTEELALDQALSKVGAEARAAFALAHLEGLTEAQVRAVLHHAGVGTTETSAATGASALLSEATEGAARALVGSEEFNPSSVQAHPTDLLLRRHRVRFGWSVALAVVAAAVVLTLFGTGTAPLPIPTGPAPVPHGTGALDPQGVRREASPAWDDTSRVDFTAWPTRGERTRDEDLLARALNAWASASDAVKGSANSGGADGLRVTRTPGTSVDAPPRSPKLLFAGNVDGASVVLFHDGERAVRYARPLSGDGDAALDLARTDEADVTSGAALVVSRSERGTRFLTAPWVDETTTRDLMRPNTPADDLAVSRQGLTGPVRPPSAGGSCATWPVMQFRSSSRIVEKHSFLLTDLGDLTPVHLTYTPLPGTGAPARQPREATGSAALLTWARTGCRLNAMRGTGVRSVNTWDFAQQQLPEGGGRAVWSCTRADTWRGPGDVLIHFRRSAASPTAPVTVVARARATAACSRFGQHIVAGTHWKSPAGHWYLLGAGSRAVTAIKAEGDVSDDERGTTFAVRAPKDAEAKLTARLDNGDSLSELPAS